MEEKKVPTIEELQAQIEQVVQENKDKSSQIEQLQKDLEESKLKIAQFSIQGLSRKVENNVVEDEDVSFDFDL